MNRLSTAALALAAAGCLGSVAWAADNSSNSSSNADQTKVVPSQGDVQQNAQKPSTSVLDDNAQREHDRNQGDKSGSRAAGSTSSSSVASAGTRDWNQIDSNHDNLVTPDEMQTWLDKNRPSGSSASSGSTSTTK